MQTLFVNAAQVVTCAGPGRARRGAASGDAGVRTGHAVLIEGERITAVAPRDLLERAHPHAQRLDCHGGVLTPGLVDSHTHGIFGKPRYEEQELRASGLGYMEIANRGGGIHSSVRDLRTRTEDELVALALPRLRRLAAHGTTTVELKSGYGLSVDAELLSLRVIRRLQEALPMRIVPTFLGAHEIPLEFRTAPRHRQEYIDLLVHEMLPVVEAEGLARFADIFCEPGVYTVEESRRILTAARAHGLLIKLHADELQSGGAAELAADIGATSADHLAAISDAGIAALAASATVATLLPGTMLFLGRERQAPARALLNAGAAIALATDFNPGSSPTPSIPMVMSLACTQMKMTPAEALTATTVNAAHALGLDSTVGTLEVGKRADFAIHTCADYREIAYFFGFNKARQVFAGGMVILNG